jgi:hypothetical protein
MSTTVICDRCQKTYSIDEKTAWFYNSTSLIVDGGKAIQILSEYANENEKAICKNCMNKHPRYINDNFKIPNYHHKTFEETMLYVYNVKEI